MIHKKCPICKKNDMVIKIVYGDPTERTMDQARREEVHLGGCILPIAGEKWYCKRDKHVF